MATDPNQPPQPGDEPHVDAPTVEPTGDPAFQSQDPSAPAEGAPPTEQDPATVTPEPGGPDVALPDGPTPPNEPVTADEADEASPTGGANTAGTPASQLDLAPPMTDESGSNIAAPNLQQPVQPDALPESSQASADALDPALVDPTKAAVARVEGRTSDAATRAQGTHIDAVPPDLNEGVKRSDAGPEEYPFPQGGDVDVATVPKAEGAQEYWPALSVEDVIILGEHELVPERLVGRRAFIVDAPRYLVPVGEEDRVWVTVRTRDEVNATLTIPLSAGELIRGGRDTTVRG